MTNPNPTETAAPRWMPAASKPGGLVRGDRIKRGEQEGLYVRTTTRYGSDNWHIVIFDGVKAIHPKAIHASDLLVRIDPPAQLPESTAGRLMLWDADNTDYSLPTSSPDEAAEYIADETAPEFGPHVVRIQVARRLPDIFAVVNYDHDKGEWKCISEHSSQAEADAAKTSIPTPTEAADGE